MRTAWGGIRRIPMVTGLCLTLALPAPLLGGCIGPTQFARPGTDQAQLAADKHDCAQWAPAVKGAVVGVGYGAMAGAAVSVNGASDRNAAIVASFVALLYGVATGTIIAGQEVRNYDRCMEARGYRPV